MALCELIDYSGRPASMIELHEYLAVTKDDMQEIRETIPPEQLDEVETGDFLVVYIVDNRSEEILGLLTVWYNKTIASLATGSGTVWGEWELDKELVVTAEIAEAEDSSGRAVRGRMAYNGHGIRGIYSGGEFYTMRKLSPIEHPKDTGEEMEPNFLCHDEETHGAHICQLMKTGASAEAKRFAKDPKVSCLLCEAVANSADHVCSPVKFD